MPAPLSLDLRRRIVEAYRRGEGTIDAVAERFSVGHATVERLLALERTSGSLEPRPHGGGTEPVVRAEDKPLLMAWMRENPSITQEELAQRYSEVTDRSACQQTMSRALERLDITRKKSPSTPRNATVPTLSRSGRPSRRGHRP